MMGATRCTALSRGPSQWCGELGKFVHVRLEDGPFASEECEMTEKEFAKRWRAVDGARCEALG